MSSYYRWFFVKCSISIGSWWSRNKLANCTHSRRPTDEWFRHLDICRSNSRLLFVPFQLHTLFWIHFAIGKSLSWTVIILWSLWGKIVISDWVSCYKMAVNSVRAVHQSWSFCLFLPWYQFLDWHVPYQPCSVLVDQQSYIVLQGSSLACCIHSPAPRWSGLASHVCFAVQAPYYVRDALRWSLPHPARKLNVTINNQQVYYDSSTSVY